jgi:hypothetical protein
MIHTQCAPQSAHPLARREFSAISTDAATATVFIYIYSVKEKQ